MQTQIGNSGKIEHLKPEQTHHIPDQIEQMFLCRKYLYIDEIR